MPTISLFYGIIISMYAGDHPAPHFHARYQDRSAVFDLQGNIVAGKMPLKQRKLISAWAVIHKDDLEADWELAESGANPIAIAPLN